MFDKNVKSQRSQPEADPPQAEKVKKYFPRDIGGNNKKLHSGNFYE